MTDLINNPPHYTSHPSGVECIQITEHMGFNLGNALKYLWRADEKGAPLDDLRKASWYIEREILRRTATVAGLDPLSAQSTICRCGHPGFRHDPSNPPRDCFDCTRCTDFTAAIRITP